MLLDEFDPKKPWNAELSVSTKTVMDAKYRARRYLFANETLTAIAHLLRDHPNVFLDNFQFALPPHQNCYLEFDIEHFHDALGAPTTREVLGEHYADKTLGIVISDNRIHTLVRGNAPGDSTIIVTPITYTMNDHSPVPAHRSVTSLLREGGKLPSTEAELKLWKNPEIDMEMAHFLGSTLTNSRATLTLDQSAELSRRFHVWISQVLYDNRRHVSQSIAGAMGEIRTILALLLWLNQPSLVTLAPQPATRRWYGHKQLPYAAHNIVKLKPNLTRKKIIRSFGHARSPRRHEVRAFWRNFEKTPGCIHDWPLFPDEHGHYHCGRCPQWRTRVREHERGDATVGFVTKHYEV